MKAVHETVIDELHVPYILPCENGGRCETAWISLDQRVGSHSHAGHRSNQVSQTMMALDDNRKDDSNNSPSASASGVQELVSLTVRGMDHLLAFSVQKYTAEDLMNAANLADLERCKRPFLSLMLDASDAFSEHMSGSGELGGDFDDFFTPPTTYRYHTTFSTVVKKSYH